MMTPNKITAKPDKRFGSTGLPVFARAVLTAEVEELPEPPLLFAVQIAYRVVVARKS